MITRIFGGIHLPVRSRRAGTLAAVTVFLAVLILVAVLGHIWENDALVTDFGRKNLRPGTAYLFGTDWLGRDMLKRTAAGLSMSIRLGDSDGCIQRRDSRNPGHCCCRTWKGRRYGRIGPD